MRGVGHWRTILWGFILYQFPSQPIQSDSHEVGGFSLPCPSVLMLCLMIGPDNVQFETSEMVTQNNLIFLWLFCVLMPKHLKENPKRRH